MATAHEKESERSDDHTAPPFLRRVRIRGYKSIAFCDVQLSPLTVFVGRNASGKSNFLDALAFLRELIDLGAQEATSRRGGPQAILCRRSSDECVHFEVECGISDGQAHFVANYAISLELPRNQPSQICHERLRLTSSDGSWWLGYTNQGGEITCEASDDKPQQRHWRNKDRPFLEFYPDSPVFDFGSGITSLYTYNFHPDAIRRLQPALPCWSLERDGSNLANVIEGMKETHGETLRRVNAYLSRIIEEVEGVDAVRYGEYATVRFRLRTGSNGNPLEFDAASMSDGTLRVLASLIAAFQINISIRPSLGGIKKEEPSHMPDEVWNLAGPSVVGIEEPETSLHPAAMRALVDALDEATGHTQILLTTHSADLLDNPTITPDNVRVVEMIDGKTVITPVDEASREIVRRKLNTLGELERQDRLGTNPDDLERQQQLSRSAQGPAA